jgi:hypothetical protein
MTDEKIISFQEEDPPLDKASILQLLKEIPDEIAEGYVEGIHNHLDELLIWKNVIAAAKHLRTAQYIIDELDEIQLAKLRKIVLGLSAKDPFEKIDELVETTLGLENLKYENIKKVDGLIEMNRNFKDFDKAMSGLYKFSFQIKRLAEFYRDYSTNKDDEEWVKSLARLPEEDIDSLLFLSKLTIENAVVK